MCACIHFLLLDRFTDFLHIWGMITTYWMACRFEANLFQKAFLSWGMISIGELYNALWKCFFIILFNNDRKNCEYRIKIPLRSLGKYQFYLLISTTLITFAAETQLNSYIDTLKSHETMNCMPTRCLPRIPIWFVLQR